VEEPHGIFSETSRGGNRNHEDGRAREESRRRGEAFYKIGVNPFVGDDG